MRRILKGWLGLALLVLAAAAMPLLLPALAGPDLPESLGSLRRVEFLAGSKAAALVDRLHGKSVATSANLIGAYRGPHGSATLYRTLYASRGEAEEDDARMAKLIEGGNNPFRHFHRGLRGDRTVSMCIGLGQVHFFFASGRSLYWLSADPSVAREALDNLLDEGVYR